MVHMLQCNNDFSLRRGGCAKTACQFFIFSGLTMKLHLNTSQGQNTITGHGDGTIAVNGKPISHAVIVRPAADVLPWLVADIAALSIADFAPVIALKPELVVFGSGKVFHFPDVSIMAAFAAAKIGFEVMDTPAACRTYNVLVSEGRNVVAALLV